MPDDVRPASWQDLITAEATKQGIDPRLAVAVADTESSFNPGAKSPVGALGLFQLMPATAKRHGVDPLDPVQNIRGGVGELKQLLDANHGDVVTTLRHYNASPGADASVTDPYVQRVLSKLKPAAQAGQPASQPGEEEPPTVGQPPPGPPETWGQWAYRHGQTLLSGFDPRTREGRRNLAGGIGAAGGAILGAPTAAVAGPAGPATTSVMGAMAGGAIESGGESLIDYLRGSAAPELTGAPPPGPAPTSLGDVASAAAAGGTEQGLYEMGGRAALWPVRMVGRRMVSTRVGRYAAEGLGRQREALAGQLDVGLQGARDLLQTTRTGARQAVTSTAERLRGGLSSAQRVAAADIARAEAEGAAGVTTAQRGAAAGTAAVETRGYGLMVGQPPPSPATAGRAANVVIQEGGAARARDLLGQAVDKAADTGPEVDIRDLKAQAQKILERQIKPPAETFPRTAPEAGAEAAVPAGAEPAASVAPSPLDQAFGGPAAVAGVSEAVTQAQAEAGRETLRHPAMGVLNRILNAADTVPFKDAHLFKRELDEAIGSTWDQSVRKQVTNVTKTLRGTLRSTLAVHEPYNAATAAYAKVAPLYTQGIAPKLRKLATEAPEAVVRLMDPKKPTNVTMLHDLLVHQAAEGGDAAGGQAAWDGVRSAWTHERLTKGGLDGMGKRLDAVEGQPEFYQTMYGDRTGQEVWSNLRAIQQAYETALSHGEVAVAGAKAAGAAGVEAATSAGRQGVQTFREAGRQTMAGVREAGAQRVEQAQAGVEAARQARRTGLAPLSQQQRELAGSSIARTARASATGAATGDVLRAMMLGPHWGGVSSISRLMHGPTAGDLVHWAALSPAGTRRLVWALTSPVPGMAVADLARGVLGGGGAEDQVGRPPQGPKAAPPVGQPPPGVMALGAR